MGEWCEKSPVSPRSSHFEAQPAAPWGSKHLQRLIGLIRATAVYSRYLWTGEITDNLYDPGERSSRKHVASAPVQQTANNIS